MFRPLIGIFACAAVATLPTGGDAQSKRDAAHRATSLAAPTSAPSPDRHLLPNERYWLSNGLEVILHQDDRLPMVAVNVWYHVGPVNEPPGRSGFAHLFEHLMFEGSKHVGRQFDHLLESVGATNINGTTSWDRTNYYETVPSEHLELALWLEADRMGFMIDTLTLERLNVQREVVKNERRQQYEDRPYGPSDLKLYDLLFPVGHPYHGAVIGSIEDLSQATMADVRSFFEQYYSPANATLTLAGNFDVVRAKSAIDQHFGSLPQRGQASRSPRPNVAYVPLKPQRAVVEEAVDLGRVAFAWFTPPAYNADEAALEITIELLDGGKDSRLYQAMVAQGVASSVSAGLDANDLVGIFEISASAARGVSTAKLERLLHEQIARLATDGPTAEELNRAKARLRLGLASELQQLNAYGGEGGRAGTLQRLAHYLGAPNALSQVVEARQAVSAEDVRRVVKRYARPDRQVVVVTAPLQKEETL